MFDLILFGLQALFTSKCFKFEPYIENIDVNF